MASVAYLRLCDNEGRIHCSFLMGKARLAPIEAVTIPRLELTAATVSVRLGEIVKKELDESLDIVHYHTDSVTVLRYISNDQKRFQVFVANRVQTIHNLSDPSQWKYVDTKENPADDASRGLDAKSLETTTTLAKRTRVSVAARKGLACSTVVTWRSF